MKTKHRDFTVNDEKVDKVSKQKGKETLTACPPKPHLVVSDTGLDVAAFYSYQVLTVVIECVLYLSCGLEGSGLWVQTRLN